MSRFPGLQFPTQNSGQPQTRGQQRPGVNLLQRLFQMKGAKLAKQGQDFQEDSFNAAKEAYEGALQTYETNKAAHDASQAQQQAAAQARYNDERATYNGARQQYESQLAGYNSTADTVRSQQAAVDDYNVYRDVRYNPGNTNWRTVGGQVYYNNSQGGQQLPSQYTGYYAGTAAVPTVTAQLPAEAPVFTASPPTYNYTATPFGSDVPSFNYVAPESPGSANANKLATMTGLSNQLQEVLPENARNRNRAPASFYNLFGS